MVEREIVSVFRIVGIKGGTELGTRVFLGNVEAFPVVHVELGSLVDATAKETQLAVFQK